MKRITAIICAALCVFALAACGKSETASDPGVDSLVSLVDSAIGGAESLSAMDADYVKGSLKMDADAYEECIVKINSIGANIDEYGIFKGADSAEAAEIKTAVDAYIQMRKDTWMTEYMPEEHPKLLAAEVWAEGNYVMYAILGDDARVAAAGAFTGAFTEG